MPRPTPELLQTLQTLHKTYPDLRYYLHFSNPLELLVAAILSAQVRDEVVNATTPVLFRKYKTAEQYAKANLLELTGIIKTITFAGNKAKHIQEACKILVHQHQGKVPRTMEELTALPGIGRKTANAILQNAFDIVEGIVVDTHVLRVAYRLGWTNTDQNAEKSEEQLLKIIPKSEWKQFPWLLKTQGRTICKAPIPSCSQCPVEKLCRKQGVGKRL
ncbi:MAG: endonuclease III [Nanoarchaeota archaeon]